MNASDKNHNGNIVFVFSRIPHVRAWIVSFIPHNNFISYVRLLSPFHRYEN